MQDMEGAGPSRRLLEGEGEQRIARPADVNAHQQLTGCVPVVGVRHRVLARPHHDHRPYRRLDDRHTDGTEDEARDGAQSPRAQDDHVRAGRDAGELGGRPAVE